MTIPRILASQTPCSLLLLTPARRCYGSRTVSHERSNTLPTKRPSPSRLLTLHASQLSTPSMQPLSPRTRFHRSTGHWERLMTRPATPSRNTRFAVSSRAVGSIGATVACYVSVSLCASRLPGRQLHLPIPTRPGHSLGARTHLSALATELAHTLLPPLVTHL